MENFYETLGLTEKADADQIKKAYRALARQHHPDVSNGGDAMFRSINRAYKVLSNPESRNDYDKTLRNFKAGTSSFDAYTADVYELQGKQIERVINELFKQMRLTRVKIRQNGRTLIDMPLSTATAVTLLGFAFAPLAMLLVNMGINRFFQMEVTNAIMESFDKAMRAHNDGDLVEAERLYAKVIEESEFFVPAHLNLGMLYRQRGETESAVRCFKKVAELAPFGQLGDMARENLEALRGF